MDNVAGLPAGPESLILRAYLDQGTPHPQQRPGHRTATVAQPWSLVKEQRTESHASLLSLSSQGVVRVSAGERE
jgi:hypothetical protein